MKIFLPQRDDDLPEALARLDVPDTRWHAAASGKQKFDVHEIDDILAKHDFQSRERIRIKRFLEKRGLL